MAEMPERPFCAGSGTAGRAGDEHQATAAGDEDTGARKEVVAKVTMEEVLGAENVEKALRRVKANKGAPGVDGMTVDELGEYLSGEGWQQIEKALLEGRYKPRAVLGVEIPKPNGGKRQLGIPTVVDRLIQQAILQAVQPHYRPDVFRAQLRISPRATGNGCGMSDERLRGGGIRVDRRLRPGEVFRRGTA